jgi:hypothetical protein
MDPVLLQEMAKEDFANGFLDKEINPGEPPRPVALDQAAVANPALEIADGSQYRLPLLGHPGTAEGGSQGRQRGAERQALADTPL